MKEKQVVHIFGASGSGTSTLGKQLSEVTGYVWMDTDDYYWLPSDPPYTDKRKISERLRLMKEDMEKAENAVISGALEGWGGDLIPYFTLGVRVVTDTDLRLLRLKKREAEHFGARILEGGDMYRNHLAFLEWAKGYDDGDMSTRSRARHDEWQRQLSCKVIVVNGAEDLERNCQVIREALQERK